MGSILKLFSLITTTRTISYAKYLNANNIIITVQRKYSIFKYKWGKKEFHQEFGKSLKCFEKWMHNYLIIITHFIYYVHKLLTKYIPLIWLDEEFFNNTTKGYFNQPRIVLRFCLMVNTWNYFRDFTPEKNQG